MTGAGVFAGQFLLQSAPKLDEAKTETPNIQQIATEMTGAPVIVDGQVLGYLVFRIRGEVDTRKLPNDKFEVAPVLLNAAFETAYEFYQSGIPSIEPHDIEKISRIITQKTNEKLGSPLVKDVEMEQFNYVPMSKVRQNIMSPK